MIYSIQPAKSGTTYTSRFEFKISDLLLERSIINFSPEEYQRFYRASNKWKTDFMVSFFAALDHNPIQIPEVCFRVQESDDGTVTEVMDGCQRLKTILAFVDNDFSLPDVPGVNDFTIEGIPYNLSGLTYSDIGARYPAVKDLFDSYKMQAQVYVNISDRHAAHVFVNVLNNSTELCPQEKRNASRSYLAKFVREIARTKPHKFFERQSNDSDLVHINLNHKKMDVDKMVAELLSMIIRGPKKGTGKVALNSLYADPIFDDVLKQEAHIIKLLKEAMSAIDRNPKARSVMTGKTTRNFLWIVSEMIKQSYKIQPDKFLRLYLKAHSQLSIVTKEYKKETGLTRSPYTQRMSGNTGEDTTLALDMVMDSMLKLSDGTEVNWVDPKRCFTKKETAIMAMNQNNICGRCDHELDANPVGAHGGAWRDGSLTLTGEGYAAHKYCNLEEGRNTA